MLSDTSCAKRIDVWKCCMFSTITNELIGYVDRWLSSTYAVTSPFLVFIRDPIQNSGISTKMGAVFWVLFRINLPSDLMQHSRIFQLYRHIGSNVMCVVFGCFLWKFRPLCITWRKNYNRRGMKRMSRFYGTLFINYSFMRSCLGPGGVDSNLHFCPGTGSIKPSSQYLDYFCRDLSLLSSFLSIWMSQLLCLCRVADVKHIPVNSVSVLINFARWAMYIHLCKYWIALSPGLCGL